jgi:hypothetical protein
MTAIIKQMKELCEEHSLHYHIDNNRVLIDDEFWFYINNQDDINNFNVYIDILKGRNEMVNTICNKLNTTIEKGCNIKLFEFHQNEMVCISDNSIFININNMTDTCYTKYERFIEFKLKIVLKRPLEYYLISEDNKQLYKLKSPMDLKNVLDQKCTFEKKQCDRNKGYEEDLCVNMVDMYKSSPNPYGLCYDESKYMLSTAHGYRNKYSSFSKYYFCSEDCMKHFAKYNRCDRCHEDGKGKYIEVVQKDQLVPKEPNLGYSLCEGRGDMNPPCIVKYEIEKRYIQEDRNKQKYKIVIDYRDNCKESNLSLKSDFEELFELIKKNDYRVSYDILTDICYARDTYSLRSPSENEVKVCSECGCTKHSKDEDDNLDECYKCNKKLWTEFYYNNDTENEINSIVCHTCCDKHNDYILLTK